MSRSIPAAALLLALATAGCFTAPQAQQEWRESACLQHFEGNPLEQTRCRLPAGGQDVVPQAEPKQLPLHEVSPGD